MNNQLPTVDDVKGLFNKNQLDIVHDFICIIRTGSHLYGVATEDSDLDLSGIFTAKEDYYIGLLNVEQIQSNIVSKNDIGRNTKDAIDCTVYDFRKYIKLLIQNNPNILEQLFVNNDNIIYTARHIKNYKI